MKTKLLLLHGALGSASQFRLLSEKLQPHFEVHQFTFSGHGGKGDPQQAFSMESFVDELQAWLEEKELRQIPVFGYSMGGYVALCVASVSLVYFTHILTLGTKFHWTPESAQQEVKRLQPGLIAQKVPAFAEHLRKLHQPHDWQQVMTKTADMMLRLGSQPLLTSEKLAAIQVPVMLMRGSEDKMVSEEESLQAAERLPTAQYISLKEQPHPLEQVDVAVLANAIVEALLP